MTAKGRKKFDKGQNYSTVPAPYLDQIAEYYQATGKLHHSHRTWIANHLVAAGKQVPADDRAMLDAVRGI